MRHRIEFWAGSHRALKRLPRRDAKAVLAQLEALAEDPYLQSLDVKKMQGIPGT